MVCWGRKRRSSQPFRMIAVAQNSGLGKLNWKEVGVLKPEDPFSSRLGRPGVFRIGPQPMHCYYTANEMVRSPPVTWVRSFWSDLLESFWFKSISGVPSVLLLVNVNESVHPMPFIIAKGLEGRDQNEE
jgi:hypothetical protein